ncbi:MAG: SpoVA/SpoVAEb family sporulation membrane protein [Agathobacter sp.]
MSELTQEQQEKRNQKYNDYVEQVTPKHNLWANMGKAFLLGGTICLLGQVVTNIAMNAFGLDKDDAGMWCSLILVLLSVILTSCNVYGLLAIWGGAGALVPITGFANGVCASAVEFQKEGQVFGIGCQIFKIAGPVILYGIFSSWVLGLIYWIFKCFGWA